jgi:hypothetical protein
MGRRKREIFMQQLLTDLLRDTIKQLIGWRTPRRGKLVLTRHALVKMHEYGLDEATLENAFQFGEQVKRGDKWEITHQYPNYSVNLWYKVIYTPFHANLGSEIRFLVITCWKGVSR